MDLRKEIEAALSRIAALEKENAELRKRLAAYENSNTPSSQQRYKPKTEQDPAKQRFPGAPKGHQGSGIHIPKPDKVEEHTLKESGLRHVGKRSQYVIDFVQQPIIVTKHIIHQYRARDGSIVEPPLDLPSGIYGKNIQAFATTLRSIGGVSFEKLAEVIRSMRTDLSICPATLLNSIDGIAQNLTSQRDNIQHVIQSSPVVNADETGMRRDGQHGYNWVFCTPTHVLYETDKSRSRNVATDVLGSEYDGAVVSDGYTVYLVYKQQRCWAHILREADALITTPEAGPPIEYLHKIFEKAKNAQDIQQLEQRKKIAQTLAGTTELQHIVSCLSTINGCKKFAKTLTNAAPNLFLGVLDPRIPLTNNHAERMLRPLVVHRKLMGCYRTKKGERFFENIMSNVMTWKLQQKPIHQNLLLYAR